MLLLLLLVAIRTTTTDAGLPTFVPLQCNSDLASCTVDDEIALSSIVNDAGEQNEIVIPCGSCVVVDYDDGTTVTFAGGLNVIGSLRFPSEAEVTIRTTHVFVQGLLKMDAPSSTGSYGILLYEKPGKHDDVYIKPHGENANECDLVSGCKVGRMPIAVVGGRLDINGLVDSNCFSHVPLLDLDESRQILTVGTEAANCWWNLNGSASLSSTVARAAVDVMYGFDNNVKACKGDEVTVSWQGYHNIQETLKSGCESGDLEEQIEDYLNSGQQRTYSNDELTAGPGERRYFKCSLHCGNTNARFEVYCPSVQDNDNEIYLTSPDINMSKDHIAKIVGADVDNGQIFVKEPIPERFQYATKQKTSDFYSRVASLKRSIFFTAEEQQADGNVKGETDKFLIGGHLMIFFTPNVEQKLQGVKITNFGQQGNLGRYPVHFHLCRDVDGSLISKNVIMNVNQRCAVIHGSHNVTLYDNVAINTFGHCYVTEDGFEIDNVFERNLGANLKFPTRKLVTSDGVFDSDERGPSVFWIMCPANHWIANVAAGSIHSGYWFETRLNGVRSPSSSIDGAENFIPSYAVVKTFKDNISHSNRRHGIQYYSPGWKPKGPESVIENMIVYRNGGVGHFVHGNGNLVIKGGIVADNDNVGIAHFENFPFRADGVTVIGCSQNYFNVLNHVGTKTNCKHYTQKAVTGVHIHPFASPKIREAQVHYSNMIFSGFDLQRSNVVPIQMNTIHNRGKVDSSPRSFVNTQFKNLGKDTLRVSVCDAFASGASVDSIIIHDVDGTIGPMIRPGTNGFLVSDEKKITTFANGDGCFYNSGLGCLRYCQSACLRMIRIEVSNSYVIEDMIMIISDGNQEEEANFKRYTPPRNDNNARSRGYYGAPLPQGNFNFSFIDKVTRKPAWPKYARAVFMAPPDCSSHADETSVTFTKPSFDADRCSQLIHDGNLENLPDRYGEMGQWQTEWLHDMQLKLVSPGYGGSGKAIKAYHKGDNCKWSKCTIEQSLDSSCFIKWIRFDLNAKVRILDRKGNDKVCKEETDSSSCGVAWLDIRFNDESKTDYSHVIGRISNTNVAVNGWYHMKGQVVIDQDDFEGIADFARLKWVISTNYEYILDEVSLSATKIDPTFDPSGQPSFSNQPSISYYPSFVTENLALGKPTYQTSTQHDGSISANAVDGNKKKMSLTKTGCSYWEVDLGYPAVITEIKIFLHDKYHHKQYWIQIFKNSNDEEAVNIRDWDRDTYPLNFVLEYRSVVGQKVRIRPKSGCPNRLGLYEVEVYGKYMTPTTSPTPRPIVLSPSPSTTSSLKPSPVPSEKPSLSTKPSSSSQPSISSFPTYVGDNLALGKPTDQTSTLGGRISAFAVDGEISPHQYTFTKNGLQSWQVDLEYPARIRKIKVFFGKDNAQDKVSIQVLDSKGMSVEQNEWVKSDDPKDFEIRLSPSIVGQKVMIGGWGYLSLREVEVYGTYLTPTVSPTGSPTKQPTSSPTTSRTEQPTSLPTMSPSRSNKPSNSSPPSISSHPTVVGDNLALNKPAWQKTTLSEAALAVDGDLSTHSYTKNGCNEWKVDLESPALIRKVKVYMKKKLKKLWIDVLDSNDKLVKRKEMYDENEPNEFEFNFGAVVGQKVRLLQDYSPPYTYCYYLGMKEVEVYGRYLPPTVSPTSSPIKQPTSVPTSYPTVVGDNLALNKPTMQQNYLAGLPSTLSPSDKAVDGTKSTWSYTKNGCNEWIVDLEYLAVIRRVKVYLKKELKQLYVDVLDSKDVLIKRKEMHDVNEPKEFELHFESAVGQKVRLRMGKYCPNYLGIKEVEVNGKFLDSPSLSPTTEPPASNPITFPTSVPTDNPTSSPITSEPSSSPTDGPTDDPTSSPVTSKPTFPPADDPTSFPTSSSTAKNYDVGWKFNENHDHVIVNVGETATFTWDSSNASHNVYKHMIGSSGICNDEGTVLSNKSPFVYEFSEGDAGKDIWFSCQIGSHCSFGFKIKFTVQTTSPTSVPVNNPTSSPTQMPMSAPTGDPTLAPSTTPSGSPSDSDVCEGHAKSKCKEVKNKNGDKACVFGGKKRKDKKCFAKGKGNNPGCTILDKQSCKDSNKQCVYDKDLKTCHHACHGIGNKKDCKKVKDKDRKKICKFSKEPNLPSCVGLCRPLVECPP